MWNLDFEKIESLFPKNTRFGSLAIETGTCRGNGARALSKKFKKVITIELSETLLKQAKEKLSLEGLTNIQFIHGNSSIELSKLLPLHLENDSIFFFLDAHWSGDSSVDWENSAWKGYGLNTAHLGKGGARPTPSEQCPLLEELRAIRKYCLGPAIILIDDMRNISKETKPAFIGENWSHLSREALILELGDRLIGKIDLKSPEQWLLFLKPA
jgi:hypothetical protein